MGEEVAVVVAAACQVVGWAELPAFLACCMGSVLVHRPGSQRTTMACSLPAVDIGLVGMPPVVVAVAPVGTGPPCPLALEVSVEAVDTYQVGILKEVVLQGPPCQAEDRWGILAEHHSACEMVTHTDKKTINVRHVRWQHTTFSNRSVFINVFVYS